MRIFPESALKPLQKLLWLSLDNNEIGEISETSLYNLGELRYLNLKSNKNLLANRLRSLPSEAFQVRRVNNATQQMLFAKNKALFLVCIKSK